MAPRMNRRPVWRVVEHRGRWAQAAEWPILAHIGPQSARARPVLGKDRHRGVVAVQPLGREDMGTDQVDERRQCRAAGPNPIRQRGDVEVDPLVGECLALPGQRQVLAELRLEDGGEQLWPRAPA